MPARLSFHLDEHMDTAVATALRQHGADVTMPREAGLMSAGDQQHLAFATAQGRVMVTRDRDYLALANTGFRHSGIVFVHRKRSLSQLVRSLVELYEQKTTEDLVNQVIYA